MISISRAYLPFDTGTFGALVVDGHEFATLELPWRDNSVSKSCIPEGTYRMRKRASTVIRRSTGGEYSEGWEVCDVPDRTFIMIHPGNWTSDTDGCLLVGRQFWWSSEGPMVRSSRDAFRDLMGILGRRDEWEIAIGCNRPEMIRK